MSQQQTVLRVQTNLPGTITGTTAWTSGTTYGANVLVVYNDITYTSLQADNVGFTPPNYPAYWAKVTKYDFLDLYSDVPIKLNKSFAELQDISKRNSDYSIGLTLPGSKKNNRFFENFFNVDATSLYFDATKRQEVDVLLGDEPLFRGYLRLNRVSVQNSKIEYAVTLYSRVGNLFGQIGNSLLVDLDFTDDEYTFNHTFDLAEVTTPYNETNFSIDGEKPHPYFYPIVHNGYVYSGDTVTFSGSTTGGTRFYTSTNSSGGTLNSYATQAAAWADGNQQYHINSPGQGLQDNQLKPALNIWSLFKLIFKTYGYKIKSDFFNTPWMKTLYMYGYFSSPQTKFSYKINNIQELPPSGIEIVFYTTGGYLRAVPCKLGTGIPCYSLSDINYTAYFSYFGFLFYYNGTILAGRPYDEVAYSAPFVFLYGTSSQAAIGTTLKYFPVPVGSDIAFMDGDYVDFSVVIDQNIKQIDIISSIAKKFDLVFIPDPDVVNQFIIEPYDFYIGTGDIYDWTPKLSWDKGFTVEPALNYVESSLLLTDSEDNDEGNKEFKSLNNRIYGQNNVYNPTDFKSQEKKIDTIFGPQLIRKWDKDGVNNIGTPLGINYAASSKENDEGNSTKVSWQYTGVKTKPKLFFWLGGFNPFLDIVGETFNAGNAYSTYSIYVSDSLETYYFQGDRLPVISHTMPMGVSDADKINNDSLCILFNSEEPTNIGVQTYNVYTENDAYNKFYNNRITNIYNPNTRFLSGYFDLKYSDVRNLKPNDIIKINEQYFVWNKIDEYNLTNKELTKVELIQFNVNPQTYPDRYFKYYYCDNPGTVFKFKTDFTNPNLLNTNFGWSVYYDHQVGSLTGSTTGFTSSFKDLTATSIVYVPYTMYEVTVDDYNSSGLFWTSDSLRNYIYAQGPQNIFSFYMPTFWLNSGTTVTGVNVFESCAQFQTARTTYGILTGSSTNHGALITPTPTPTLTPTPTPTATSVMRGSLIMSFDELIDDRDVDGYAIYVNGIQRNNEWYDANELYSTYLYEGDVVQILLFDSASTKHSFGIYRRDYTTDDTLGNMGIVDNSVTYQEIYSGETFNGWQFTATTINGDYNFEYRVDITTYFGTPTPTPTPTLTPTPTPGPVIRNLYYRYYYTGNTYYNLHDLELGFLLNNNFAPSKRSSGVQRLTGTTITFADTAAGNNYIFEQLTGRTTVGFERTIALTQDVIKERLTHSTISVYVNSVLQSGYTYTPPNVATHLPDGFLIEDGLDAGVNTIDNNGVITNIPINIPVNNNDYIDIYWVDNFVNYVDPTPTPTVTPTLTTTPTRTPTQTPTPTVTPTLTPGSGTYTYLGRTNPDGGNSGDACSSYLATRAYISLRSTPSSIIVGDIIYDSYPSTPTNGNNNWIALKLQGIGTAYSFQIDSNGQVIQVGGSC